MAKMIRVTSCQDCPFFIQTMGGLLASFLAPLTQKAPLAGECDYPLGTVRHYGAGAVGTGPDEQRDRKFNRLKIKDGETLPEECPLQRNSVTVTLVD